MIYSIKSLNLTLNLEGLYIGGKIGTGYWGSIMMANQLWQLAGTITGKYNKLAEEYKNAKNANGVANPNNIYLKDVQKILEAIKLHREYLEHLEKIY